MNLHTLWLDLKYVSRHLKRYPGFTFMSMAALAIGIGLVTAMFTIVDGTILKGPNFAGGKDLRILRWQMPVENMFPFIRIQDFDDIAEQQTVFDELGFWTGTGANLRSEDATRLWNAAQVSANWLDILGNSPTLGRGFYKGEDVFGAEKVVIIGYRVWVEQFDSEPDVVGQNVSLNGQTHTIVGVMEEGFRFPVAHDVWIPYQEDRYKDKRSDSEAVWAFGFIPDGMTEAGVLAELDQIAARMAEQNPDTNELYLNFELVPFIHFFMDESEEVLLAMLAAVVLVLFIACSNVANLILAKSVARTQELAIRRSVGASRGRLMTQILTETAVITFAGGLLGLLLSLYALDWFGGSFSDVDLPFWFDLTISMKTIALLAVLICGTALLSGLYPAWAASRLEISHLLADQTRSSSGLKVGRFNKSLIIFQISLSLAALVGAFGMMWASMVATSNDYPFDPETILQAQVSINEEQIPRDKDVVAFYTELDRRLEEQPGVEFAAQTSSHSMVFPWTSRVVVEGKDYSRPDEYETIRQELVSWDYFRSLEIKTVEGRDFLQTDGESMGETDSETEEWVGIINEAMAKQFWPDVSPIGRRIRDTWRSDAPWVRIIGVVPNLNFSAMDTENDMPHLFRVSNQAADRGATIFMKVQGDPAAFIPTLEKIVREVNPDIVAREPMSVAMRMDKNMRGLTVITTIFAASGFVALLLGSIGIYGVISFAATQRTREFGIRLALGASPRKIMQLVMRSGFWQLGIGIPLGLLIGFGLLQGLAANLQNIDFRHPLVFILPLVAISTVSLLAAFFPAFRASKINPTEAIRDL